MKRIITLIILGIILLNTSCNKKVNYTCYCLYTTTDANSSMTYTSEGDITVKGDKDKGVEACATQNKHTTDANGISTTAQCELK